MSSILTVLFVLTPRYIVKHLMFSLQFSHLCLYRREPNSICINDFDKIEQRLILHDDPFDSQFEVLIDFLLFLSFNKSLIFKKNMTMKKLVLKFI